MEFSHQMARVWIYRDSQRACTRYCCTDCVQPKWRRWGDMRRRHKFPLLCLGEFSENHKNIIWFIFYLLFMFLVLLNSGRELCWPGFPAESRLSDRRRADRATQPVDIVESIAEPAQRCAISAARQHQRRRLLYSASLHKPYREPYCITEMCFTNRSEMLTSQNRLESFQLRDP